MLGIHLLFNPLCIFLIQLHCSILFLLVYINNCLSYIVCQVGFDPVAAAKAAKSTGSGGGGIPRQDLPGLLEKNILAEINLTEGKTSWQNRKTAMEVRICAELRLFC